LKHGGSAEGEAKSFGARAKKLDFEQFVGDASCLPDQLVEALFAHSANAEIASFE
jgi:hypothetical protein